MQSSPLICPAIYARVSSEQQAQQHTIASQIAALRECGDETRLMNAAVFLCGEQHS